MSQLLTTPLEWLHRLQNNFKDIQNYFQNEALRASQQKKIGKLATPKAPLSSRKPKGTPQVPASVKVRNYQRKGMSNNLEISTGKFDYGNTAQDKIAQS